ncbi:hypothetical protein FGO68_gene13674 [Halteria grandinella]|uniref:Uncharacterized protein n=1 Tax=Halteria grandinella TaxID=5974 RepID=A0A8J8NDN9_HALGN|nr:hypothetical protein FGO68_gene13674 [Halteria grandinella]
MMKKKFNLKFNKLNRDQADDIFFTDRPKRKEYEQSISEIFELKILQEQSIKQAGEGFDQLGGKRYFSLTFGFGNNEIAGIEFIFKDSVVRELELGWKSNHLTRYNLTWFLVCDAYVVVFGLPFITKTGLSLILKTLSQSIVTLLSLSLLSGYS